MQKSFSTSVIKHKLQRLGGQFGAQVLLIGFTLLALFPIYLVLINSFKNRKAIFKLPFALPIGDLFSLVGYDKVFSHSNFPLYFWNSLVVALVSMFLILLLGAMAAFALSEYRFPGNRLIALLLFFGIMIPIRLGTVSIMRLMVSLHLINTLAALILVNVASSLPVAVMIIQQFMAQVPREMKDAARVDGASEYALFGMVLPLVKPAIATVAVYSVVPIWNDLWFPLILAPSEKTKTLTLGAQLFVGQYTIDWNAVLSSLTVAIVPMLLLYLLFSRQLIGGLTNGSIK